MSLAESAQRRRSGWARVLACALAGLALSACGALGRSATPTTSGAGSGTSTTTSTSTSTTTPTTTSTRPSTSTSAPHTPCVSPVTRWPLQRIANQLLMVIGEFSAVEALAPEAQAGVGGFVFLGEPTAVSGPAIRTGLTDLDDDAAGAGHVSPWMSTDTEGGPVSRLANVLGIIPSPRGMVAEWTAPQVEATMAARGAALRQIGITMDLAPVLDTASATDPVASESQRSFSATPDVVAAYGTAFAAGLRAAGIVAVGKHFPGLGHASADTDTGPANDPPLAELRGDDLVPFSRVIDSGLPVVMVGHPIVPGLTEGLPA
ncbi:MAG: glycoside hydrolase family 3 N-terminal domain-containing protein, partial [Acidimicrobiales bacterium]